MKTLANRLAPLAILALASNSALAMVEDDPVLTLLKVDQLEARDSDEGTVTAWEGHFWVGRDETKLWFKTEGERSSDETETAEYQLLLSLAVDPYWDLQLGFRHDDYPRPSRDWAAIGFLGVAPYWVEIDSALFVDKDGQTNLRLQAEYEMMLTQKWVLSPEIEIDLYGKDEERYGIGSGIATIEAGLRLRYEFAREFAPYIGLHHERLLGDTRRLARDADAETSETQWVAGIRFWF